MWWVRPATMTRKTERLSRLLRLWLTTMPSDFHDFRPNDFATFRRRSATLTELPISTRGRRLFFSPADLRRVPPGAAWALPGFRPDLKAVTFFSPLYCIAALFAKNLDFLLYLRLTSKCKYAILYLPKGSKCKLNFERGLYHEKDF